MEILIIKELMQWCPNFIAQYLGQGSPEIFHCFLANLTRCENEVLKVRSHIIKLLMNNWKKNIFYIKKVRWSLSSAKMEGNIATKWKTSMLYFKMEKFILTSTIFVAQIRKSPHIPQSNTAADASHEEVNLACPRFSLLNFAAITVQFGISFIIVLFAIFCSSLTSRFLTFHLCGHHNGTTLRVPWTVACLEQLYSKYSVNIPLAIFVWLHERKRGTDLIVICWALLFRVRERCTEAQQNRQATSCRPTQWGEGRTILHVCPAKINHV